MGKSRGTANGLVWCLGPGRSLAASGSRVQAGAAPSCCRREQRSPSRGLRAACPPWCQLGGSPCTPGTAEALSTLTPGTPGTAGKGGLAQNLSFLPHFCLSGCPVLGRLVRQAWRSWLCGLSHTWQPFLFSASLKVPVKAKGEFVSPFGLPGEELIEIISKGGLTGRGVAFAYSKLL